MVANKWPWAIAIVIFIIIVSRGAALGVFATYLKFILPIAAVYYLYRKGKQAILKGMQEALNVQTEKPVIKICGKCGKEENSCLKCKVFGA